MLAERVETLAGKDGGVGIVVGIIEPGGRRVVAYGHLDQGSSRSLDGDTAFEIGSVGKVFTALLLADMVRRREVALEDPVAKYLPGVKLPERNGRSITLLDLATHTSGLPFMTDRPPTFEETGQSLAPDELYRFLARYPLPRDIGSEWDYSNLGYWLLGEAMSVRTGEDFETLLRSRITGPLRLNSTAITLSPALKSRLAVGHDAVLQPSGPVSSIPMFAVMRAAGVGLVSTANDLLTLLGVAMGYQKSPLLPTMTTMLRIRRPIQNGMEQALGWVVIGRGDDELVIHDGGTLGHASAVAWDRKRGMGVVVLSNQVAGVSDIARHLLRPAFPLERPTATRRTEIAVDPTALDTYAGRYEATGEGVFLVVRERDFLTFEAPAEWGLPRLRIRPESLRDFFASELPLRVTFQTAAGGQVTGVVIHPPRGQKPILAVRLGAGQ